METLSRPHGPRSRLIPGRLLTVPGGRRPGGDTMGTAIHDCLACGWSQHSSINICCPACTAEAWVPAFAIMRSQHTAPKPAYWLTYSIVLLQAWRVVLAAADGLVGMGPERSAAIANGTNLVSTHLLLLFMVSILRVLGARLAFRRARVSAVRALLRNTDRPHGGWRVPPDAASYIRVALSSVTETKRSTTRD